MGYANVFYFKGGIPEWRSFHYPLTVNEDYASVKVAKLSPQELHTLLRQDSSIYVLDVRPIDCSMENIFIHEAHICPMLYLADWQHNIPRNARIVVTDWTNKKAILAAKYLISRGFDVLAVLKGGIVRWRDEKLPLEHIDSPLTHDPTFCGD